MELQNRYEFVYLFDVENGNPNGDPDAGNLPRIDPETNHGLVTDVCLKRKVRNFVQLTQENKSPFEIYVVEKGILNNQHQRAHKAVGIAEEPQAADGDEKKKSKKERKGKGEEVEKAKEWMCKNFFDVRTFGAVMTTEYNCGQVRGPVQINFAKSLEPVVPLEISITRMAVTTAKEAEAQEGDNRTMGRKYILPYGLYRAEGFISAHLAQQTGFSQTDLELLWQALSQMFDHDHSASRGKMNARRLIVFKHDTALGNAPSHKLFDLVQVGRKAGSEGPARSYGDYEVKVNQAALPKGVNLEEKI